MHCHQKNHNKSCISLLYCIKYICINIIIKCLLYLDSTFVLYNYTKLDLSRLVLLPKNKFNIAIESRINCHCLARSLCSREVNCLLVLWALIDLPLFVHVAVSNQSINQESLLKQIEKSVDHANFITEHVKSFKSPVCSVLKWVNGCNNHWTN